ncbi:amino acid ABC transporter permease [Campylobacter sp. 19-13652]|uniref:amino acid ABC transporter permease n=1 Tax=Campylobacter sp. 19-13652 TaxID=2840180 RepID=UPI001C75198D|nr:amino acid ABC transporter permease [Campylobacter sp. 19-13652]BCX78734.1 amino acid ABC transporter permease [Campylobacter sp. 19-13652]
MSELFDTTYFFNSAISIINGVPITFLIAAVSFAAGGAMGFFIALLRIYKVPFLSQLATVYISFFRGTPLLVQIFMFYYGIPIFLRGIGVESELLLANAIYYAFVIFSLYASGYMSEIFRAGILAVDRGQIEAAYSLGFTTRQAFMRIILPQAIMLSLPNLLNFFIMQIKNTSLVSVITVADIMGLADIESGRSSKFLEVYFMAAMMYWAICVGLEVAFKQLERRLSIFRRSFV